MNQILRFDGALAHDPAVDVWLDAQTGELGVLAREWFDRLRGCGDDVLELMHDGVPTACVGDAPFAYVGVFKTHVNVGFFQGADLPDPEGVLEGTGRRMRHVKIRAVEPVDSQALDALI